MNMPTDPGKIGLRIASSKPAKPPVWANWPTAASLVSLLGDKGPRLLEVDTIVLCAGQEPLRALADALLAKGRAVHVIGGADVAAELDAKRAIDQGARLAASL